MVYHGTEDIDKGRQFGEVEAQAAASHAGKVVVLPGDLIVSDQSLGIVGLDDLVDLPGPIGQDRHAPVLPLASRVHEDPFGPFFDRPIGNGDTRRLLK